MAEDNPFRPYIGWLTCDDYVISCMQECWAESPEQRPDFKTIWQKLKPMRAGMYVKLEFNQEHRKRHTDDKK